MNRRELIRLIEAEFDEDRGIEEATHITQFYRSPGASGYHRASDYTAGLLRDAGMDRVWVERFPLDGETRYLGQLMPMAWEPISAELRLRSPEGELMVSYEDAYSCLPWWSQQTPEGGVTVELVDVGTGERPEDYQRKDVKGKAVLVRSNPRPSGFAHAATLAMEAGAAGVITDYLLYETEPFRTRRSLPDAVQLLRMPSQQHNSAWALAVDYNAGEKLAALAAGDQPKVFVDIRCRNFKGEAENLLADISGTDKADEYLLFVCHATAGTRPGANCASGPAMLAEMARVMSGLISSGRVPRPRRTIRFLVNVEGHGSKNYIHNHRAEIKNTIASISLDSVAHDQRKSKSALLYYHSPDSLPTFINDYFVGVMADTPKETRWVFHTADTIPFVNFLDHPYTPWSDNKYYPVFGVPAPLLMSWPDLYFHSQLLTADNLDPAVFRRCGIPTILAALELASAGPDETLDIMREVTARSEARLTHMGLEARRAGDTSRIRRRMATVAERDQRAVQSALALVSSEERAAHPELESAMGALQQAIGERLAEATGWLEDGGDPEEYGPGEVTPRRLLERDPPTLAGTGYWDLYEMAEEMQARDPKMNYDSLRIIGDEVWNFADGTRTVNQIADAIGAEFDFDLEPRHVLRLYHGLEREGLVSLG